MKKIKWENILLLIFGITSIISILVHKHDNFGHLLLEILMYYLFNVFVYFIALKIRKETI